MIPNQIPIEIRGSNNGSPAWAKAIGIENPKIRNMIMLKNNLSLLRDFIIPAKGPTLSDSLLINSWYFSPEYCTPDFLTSIDIVGFSKSRL